MANSPTCSAAARRPLAWRRNPLILCLITDRRRLVAAAGWPDDRWRDALVAQIAGAIAGGVHVVQIRERGLDDRDLAGLVRQCATLNPAARVVVNDRLDIALAAGATGVHLREDSIGIAAARRLTPEHFWVGRSVHDSATAEASRSADYLIAGSVFETVSKPGRRASMGVDGLRDVVRRAGDCPVWALGGITAARASEVVRCGARGVAAIGAFLPGRPTGDLVGAVQEATKALRFSFDTSGQLS